MAGKSKGGLTLLDPEAAIALLNAENAERDSRRAERERVALARAAHNTGTLHIPFTKERKAKVLAAISVGMKISSACQMAGVSERTVFNHRQNDTEFAAQWELALEASIEPIEDSLLEVVHEGDVNSMARVKAAEVMLAARSRRYRRDSQNARAVLTQKEADGSTKSFAISTGDYIPS